MVSSEPPATKSSLPGQTLQDERALCSYLKGYDCTLQWDPEASTFSLNGDGDDVPQSRRPKMP